MARNSHRRATQLDSVRSILELGQGREQLLVFIARLEIDYFGALSFFHNSIRHYRYTFVLFRLQCKGRLLVDGHLKENTACR